MKKIIIVFTLSTVVAFWGCNQTPKYEIQGHLDGAETGWAYLSQQKDGKIVHMDSAEIKNGDFSMTGTLEHPDIYYLQVKDKRGALLLFMENNKLTISGNVDSLWLAKAEGSPYQEDYNAYQEMLKPYEEQYRVLYGQWQQARMTGNEALAKEIEDKYDSLTKEQQKVDEKFIEEHPKSLVSPYLLRSMAYNLTGEEMQKYLDQMDSSFDSISFVQELEDWAEAKKRVAVGQKAPDFAVADTSGNTISLSSILGKGYVLIDFWAAWCSPCRQENPNLVKTYKKYHDKGFDIIGVSLDQDRSAWLGAIQKDGLLWTQVSALQGWKDETAKLYAVRSIPSNFLLDKDGVIIERNLRGDALKKKLAELLD
jgi:peroxiredoxin